MQDVFGIHVSSWRDLDWAQRHCRELEAKGYETWVNRVEIDGALWHRVLVGRYQSLEAAMQGRPSVLDSLGMDHALIYRLQAESMAVR
ncbi:SPOR domain-containing protein [Salidesulfovibrio onnuriiensis]|uniref:SPOR domain-containing protein n=1 Tax=Salidesulfovibrio onnuriiensis TaxID=2583823 RepID=UPI00164F0B2F